MATAAVAFESNHNHDYDSNLNQKIIGGSIVEEGVYPFFAQFVNVLPTGSYLFCGATLIHDDIMISAAHCGVPAQCNFG